MILVYIDMMSIDIIYLPFGRRLQFKLSFDVFSVPVRDHGV